MRESPVFVPCEGEHLATVLTIPDGPPVGMVLFLTGTGAPRSHRFQMWTRLSRALAEYGVGSMRMEYGGVGDSTGRLVQPVNLDSRIVQVHSVARFGLEALQVDRLGVVGNCTGGILGLTLAARMEQCTCVVAVLPRLVQLGGINKTAMRVRRSELAKLIRRNLPRRLVRNALSGGKDMPTPLVAESFEPALERARLLFLYSQDEMDPYLEKSRKLLAKMADRLSPEKRARLDIRVTPEGRLSGFESLAVQEWVMTNAIGWIGDWLELPDRAIIAS